MIHYLKTWPEFFEEVKNGNKPFEIRKDDREYNVNDSLVLVEYSLKDGYTGRKIQRLITFKLKGGQFGLEKGYCALGLKNL